MLSQLRVGGSEYTSEREAIAQGEVKKEESQGLGELPVFLRWGGRGAG